ncbi:MAG TPA: lysophospholipid acyltransferase family protein [Candidatus Tectomicrobia bacterium]|nr:lysophospholipid acyltransferase family protein [Candidatus Tectomicrobia bacterium]
MTVDPLYAALRWLARFWIWFLFRRVDVRHPERVPATGPLLLCVNHPNNLIDSLLVGVVVRRKVHYLATAALFRNPLVGRFLAAAGVIPVHRREDDPARADRNEATFAACHRAFDRGAVVAIYPEGTTHAEARVQRIRTGAARIALAYEATRPGALRLVPVGLSFEARKAFRARVLVAFGEPIAPAAYRGAWLEDPVKAVEALTRDLQWAMEAQVVSVERLDEARLLRALEQLYRDDLARQVMEGRGLRPQDVDLVRLSRTIADAVRHFTAREPERVQALWQRIEAYRSALARHRVRDDVVAAQRRRWSRPAALRASWYAVAGLPVFAYGAIVNALPYLVPRWLAHRLARKETDYATIRILASVVAFPLFWGLEVWLVARRAEAWLTLAFAVSLPLSGLLAYRYLVGAGRLRARLRFARLAARHAQAARWLVAERQAIIAELERAKQEYLAATRGSSF